MQIRRTSLNLALAAASIAFTTAPALAIDEVEQRSVGVAHSDLDLATDEGKAELEHRIDQAAKEACGFGESQVGTRVRTREQRACYNQTKREFERHFAEIIAAAERGG